MFGDVDSLIRLDMSEYMEKHTVSKLIGSPPGYVGYEQGGQLTEKIRKKPYAVILFDEIEKAHPDIFNILLQVMDEGHLTDGQGRKVNFKNTLILMSSNIGAKEASDFNVGVGFKTSSSEAATEERIRSIIEKSFKNKFKPEFLNRLDEVIIFNSLTKENISKIIINEIQKLIFRINEIGYDLKLSQPAVDYLADVGYDKEYGARPLARAIQKHIEDPVCEEILSGNIAKGDIINIDYDKKAEKLTIKGEPKKAEKVVKTKKTKE
jgi:ATP-dependent Clp protease ATP-binding subunit ClpC